MNFAIIHPTTKTIELVDCVDYRAALVLAGLDQNGVDFGTVAQWKDGSTLSIIVYEFGLIEPVNQTPISPSTINSTTAPRFSSKADPEGETVDFPSNLTTHLNEGCEALLWLGTVEAVEAAITSNQIPRPQSSINGVPTWTWNKEPKQ